MIARSTSKTMNWQDVTVEQLSSHWDGMEDISGFELAKYQNAYAYGDIAGEGIDVRCEYADEAVYAFKCNLKSADIQEELYNKGWSTHIHDYHLLEMHKGNDIALFNIESNDEVGYMTMTITNEYADECSSVIAEYFEQAEGIMNLFGRRVVVNESNIIDLFQQVAKKYFDYTFDAGEGMRNVYIDDIIIQVYPYNEYHDVWVLNYDTKATDLEHSENELKDFDFPQQMEFLKMYYEKVSGDVMYYEKKNVPHDVPQNVTHEKGNINKDELQKKFIEYCEERGAFCYRNEYQGHNDMAKEIVYCTKLGIVYHYFDNNGDNVMPTIQTIAYPLPSKLVDEGIIHYLFEECLNAGMTAQIREIADFLDLSNDDKDIIGVPQEYFYGWVWENGGWDGKAEYEDLHLINVEDEQTKKDCEYLKSIYPMLKGGWHIEEDGTQRTESTTENMVGNAEQFCTYFKESGLSLQEFLSQYDDMSREDSLWSKCNKYALDLVTTYIGDGIAAGDTASQLADIMHSFIVNDGTSSYFPKK